MPKPEHLKRGAAETDALFSSIGEGAIVTDINGNVSRINNAALIILGRKPEDIIGKWYPNIVRAEYEDGRVVPNLDRPITKAFLTGKVVRARLYYLRPAAPRVAVELSVAPVIVDGRPSGAIQVFRDITQDLALEKAKDEFISLASHQLRTPATGVKQYTSMLLEGYAGPVSEAQKNMLQSIYDSNERQITIVNDLLKVAHVDAGQVQIEKEEIDLVKLVSDIINEQKYKFKTHHQNVHLIHTAPELKAFLDTKNVRMVLENIIDNASKYTPDKKSIFVTLKSNAHAATIAVRDEGVGIPKADISKVFHKFSRLHNSLSLTASGTGLGLYWANKIILLHGGTIKVKSVPNKGTTFTVIIPHKKRVYRIRKNQHSAKA